MCSPPPSPNFVFAQQFFIYVFCALFIHFSSTNKTSSFLLFLSSSLSITNQNHTRSQPPPPPSSTAGEKCWIWKCQKEKTHTRKSFHNKSSAINHQIILSSFFHPSLFFFCDLFSSHFQRTLAIMRLKHFIFTAKLWQAARIRIFHHSSSCARREIYSFNWGAHGKSQNLISSSSRSFSC